jgi:hypothetical protein
MHTSHDTVVREKACRGFIIGFESRGAHGCEEQWNTRDTRVWTCSGLLADKNPTSYMRQCIMIAWAETHSTPLFIG